jgi:hypothetical protein
MDEIRQALETVWGIKDANDTLKALRRQGFGMSRPPHYENVYKIVDEEIAYANAKYDRNRPAESLPDCQKPIEFWIAWMANYLLEANKKAMRDYNKAEALANIRKLAGLAINCMRHNPPPRRSERINDEKCRG